MSESAQPITILMADDDDDDRRFAQEALEECRLADDLHFVEDGEQLLDFLHKRPPYEQAPRPGLILLDLNMPRIDGREALLNIKADPSLRQVPIVVLTTSKAEQDIYESYDTGANSFITKPVTFRGLVQVLKELGRYWFEVVDLPPEKPLE